MSAVQTLPRHLLRHLNLFGLDHLDPVVLAALADERPLLLVGAHGTAKSELLNRLAVALDLEHRHFNASLISFDDLLGYPVPNEHHDGLTYLRTPGDLWDAESVFLDEISRCRPETQNKLFSVIHERRVQGLALARLRYRWAAMNPPAAADDGEDEDAELYHGSLPLDPALADRFPYVITMPTLLEISAQERTLLIQRGGQPPADPSLVGALVAEARRQREALPAALREWFAAWVGSLAVPLREARWPISARRAVSLLDSALSVHAACLALGQTGDPADHAWLALKWGLPQRAMGRPLDEARLRAVHRSALESIAVPPDSPWARVRAEADPVRRVQLARELGGLPTTALNDLVHDALAAQPPAERHALACALLPALSDEENLSGPTCELLATLADPVLHFCASGEQQFEFHRSQAPLWSEVGAEINRLEKAGSPLHAEVGNLLMALFAMGVESFAPAALSARYVAWREMFPPAAESEAA